MMQRYPDWFRAEKARRRKVAAVRARIRFAIVLFAGAFCAVRWAHGQDRPVSSAFYFNVITQSSGGTFTNADSAPTWSLLKNGNTVVTTGTFTVCGTGTLAGDYYGSLTLNSGSWSIGDTYAIEATGTVSSVPGKRIVAQGFVLPAWVVTGEYLTYGGGGTMTSGGTVTANGGTVATVNNAGSIVSSTGALTGLPTTTAGTQGGLMILGANTGTHSFSGNATYSGVVSFGNFTTGSTNFGTTGFTAFNPGTTTFTALALTNASTISLATNSVGSVLNSTGALGSVTLNTTQGTIVFSGLNLGAATFATLSGGTTSIATLNTTAGNLALANVTLTGNLSVQGVTTFSQRISCNDGIAGNLYGNVTGSVASLTAPYAIRSNTAQGGASGSITLDASASATTDFYKGDWIVTTGGTGSGQCRLCMGYSGTTKIALVTPAWATNPANDTTFSILPAAAINTAGAR